MKKLIPILPEESAIDAPNYQLYQEMEIDTLARTLWREARGEGTIGMHAVACVILNRVQIAKERDGMWWGNNIIQVCQKPYQFSCWNRNDPNFKKLLNISPNDLYFATALRLARCAVHGSIDDITNNADHYHAAGISPSWIKNERPVYVLGRHIFYRLHL